MPRLPRPGRRRASAAAAGAAGAAAAAVGSVVGALRWSRATRGFVAAPPSTAGAAAVAASSAAAGLLGTGVSDAMDAQLLLAEKLSITGAGGTRNAFFQENGPDFYFFGFIFALVAFVLAGIFYITKPYWEKRWLQERVNDAKLKFITQEDKCTPEDQYELGRLYIALPDPSSALAEFEEVEEEFDDMRRVLDPEDAMGALAARAMLHNSKGFALTNLEPPRTAQARREFVRAVTYWPEYPEGLLNIGRELLKRKRFDVALRTLNTAAKWQPGSKFITEATEEAQAGLDEIEYQNSRQ